MSVLSSASCVLSLIQILIIVLPYPAYIHPDEYFQSTEIMAGDVLQLKSLRTWEWNRKEPSRNIVFPFLAAGLPFMVLRKLQQTYTVNILIILPRLMMLGLTYIIETLLVRIVLMEKRNKNDMEFLVFLFRSSHVTLVFLSRTFSNTLETLLFALTIFVIERLKENEHKATLFSFFIGCIGSVGFFVRPSFSAFMFGALFIYGVHLLYCNNLLNVVIKSFKFILVMTFGFLMVSLLSIYLDNYYFNGLSELQITSYNLIKYNANIKNLKEHGIHYRGLHFAVNMCLLFGPIYVIFICLFVKSIKALLHGIMRYRTLLGTLKLVLEFFHLNSLLMTTVLPVVIMSLIPHQEPRYIIAAIVPLLCTVVSKCKYQMKSIFISLWLIFNFLGILWYGFLHQAGLVPVLTRLNEQIRNKASADTFHLVFWKTYQVPEHLLGVQKNDASVNVVDLGGTDVENVTQMVSNIYVNKKPNEKVCLMFFFLPSRVFTFSTLYELI